MIKREYYVKQVRGFYDSDLIKIITGIRRCGKSVILEQIMEELKEKTDNIIYLNFEDKKVKSIIENANDLLDYVEKNRKKGKCYIFLDEIQVVNDWQDSCKTLRLHDNSVFITGSNSKLLSKEFTKELSGRYVSFKVRPFVYKEILEYANELGKEISTTDYLIWGGFPKRIEFDTTDAQIKYLEDLDETIVLNDLINRYHIRKIDLFKSIVNYVLRSNGRIVSAKSIHSYISSNNENCSINTIIKFLGYLEEAYIIEKIKEYSTKTKTDLKYFFKLYNEDVALNSIRCLDGRYDLSHNLENIVFNELSYMGYNVNVLNIDNREIDFVAQKVGFKYYIQVAYSLEDEKAYEREFSAFGKIDNNVKKIIITNDEIDYSTSTVKHIKFKDFILLNSLEEIN